MQDNRQPPPVPQYRPTPYQDTSRVQGQPFPGTQYLPPTSMLPFQPQQPRQQTAQQISQPLQQPTTRAMLPPMTAQWTASHHLYTQALKQQQQTLMSSQTRLPQSSFTPASAPNFAPVARPVSSATKAIEASRKYGKKRKLPEATAVVPPKPVPLPKERMLKSELFSKLQDQDDRILRAIVQQKLATEPALRPGEHVKKKLRIYVQSEHHNQLISERTAGELPYWSVTIWGKLMDTVDALSSYPPQATPEQKHVTRPLSNYIKRLLVSVKSDKSHNGNCKESQAVQEPLSEMEGNSEEIVWAKTNHKAEHRDRFCFRRNSDQAAHVSIQVAVDSQPELFSLSEPMSQLMRCRQCTRPAALQALMAYIKMHALQVESDQFQCDTLLQSIFKEKSVKLASLPELLDSHLHLAEPYAIEYGIRVEGPPRGEIACYDLDLYVALNPSDPQAAPVFNKIAPDPMIDHLQLKVNGLIAAANERSRRRDMLLAFSSNPVEYINGLISSQARDLRAQKPTSNPTAMRRSQFFDGRWVDDAVLRYLHRKLAAGA